MNEDDLISRFGLVPCAADLPEIRGLITSLTLDDERDGNEVLKTLSVQLFSAGDPNDALLIYKAKMSSFDAGCYIDLELTCGAGLEETKIFLEKSDDPAALRLLEDLAGGFPFKDFTPSAYLYYYKRYYGLSTQAVDLLTEDYSAQVARWPQSGKHILAQYDTDTIIVYQAYRPGIAHYALENGEFGGDFSYSRMSWIKPNFLWMMYRSGWAEKKDQEMILGLRLRRTFFDRILGEAVESHFNSTDFATHDAWKHAVETSEVRLQWDPDHDPAGKTVARRAIQLGLKGETLEEYGGGQVLEVIDMTEFVKARRDILKNNGVSDLNIPLERVYRPADPALARRLNLD